MTLPHTPSQTAGPYLHIGMTNSRSRPRIAEPEARGEHIHLECRVLDGDGTPVTDAMIEIWQANADGKYRHPEDVQEKLDDPACRGFGRLATDGNGMCVFETVIPGAVPGRDGEMQAPHLNVSIFARGLLKHLATRIYFAGNAANQKDAILALVPEERRNSLMAVPDPSRPGLWFFSIQLSGENETVFFDI
jgi:protocatechuate 3,4-dioxygenase, alpha subunit